MPDTKHRNATVDDVSEIEDNREVHKHRFNSKREKFEWYLDEIDCYKEDMGKWYTLFVRRFIPAMVCFMPIFVIVQELMNIMYNNWFKGLMAGISESSFIAMKYAIAIVAFLIFVIILIFLPRFATVCEFGIGTVFYVLAAHSVIQYANHVSYVAKPIITNPLGYFVAIVLGIFLFMKFVFLVIEIIYMITFRNEHHHRSNKSDETDVVF